MHVISHVSYHNRPKYLDRLAFANNVDPDQTLQNVASDQRLQVCHTYSNTLQPLYNMVHYNTVLDVTRFKDGSQKCIGYIEK